MNLPNDIASCHELILAQQELIQKLLKQVQQVEQLEAKVKELEARLNQNSRNSHRPPSSDGLGKQPAFPRKKGKKQGGQRGHKGKTLDMVVHPDHLIAHAPQRCYCGCDLRDVSKQTIERRQVFDLPQPKLEVSEHQLQSCVCPRCQRNNVGIFPAAIASRVQYGNGVRALTVLLNTGFKLPFGKIRQFFTDVFGYELNEGTQINAQVRCYEQLADSEQCIRQNLLNSPVNHFDETGLRVQGKLHWLHNCSNGQYTYQFVHPKRGQQALDDEASLLPHYKGWAIHDCWRSYFLYGNCRHGTCNAHLLRELQFLIEQGSHWASQMKDLLLYAYVKSSEGHNIIANLPLLKRQYELICTMAQKEEPPPEYRHKNKRARKTKGRNLLERLIEHKEAVLAFAQYKKVPFTNNQAERDVRPAKIKQKIAGSFRTLKSAKIYARIQGFISTTRKHQLNVFNELVAVFNGSSFLTAPLGC